MAKQELDLGFFYFATLRQQPDKPVAVNSL
jgi:hypothetical protein